MHKKFDKTLYEENDEKAKSAATQILNKAGYKYVIESDRKYEVDLRVLDDNGNTEFYVEVEIKKVWNTEKFPFENVQFPERKKKYCQLDKPTKFIMFSRDMKNYLVVDGKDLLESPLQMVRNIYISYGEQFFQVDLNKVIFNEFI